MDRPPQRGLAVAADADETSFFVRKEGEESKVYAERIFRRLFHADIDALIRIETLWEKRQPPTVHDLTSLVPSDAAPSDASASIASTSLGLTDTHKVRLRSSRRRCWSMICPPVTVSLRRVHPYPCRSDPPRFCPAPRRGPKRAPCCAHTQQRQAKRFVSTRAATDASQVMDRVRRLMQVWSVEESARVFLTAVQRYLDTRADEMGSATFDKDDDLAVDFVTAASNLRAGNFGIADGQQTWFATKVSGSRGGGEVDGTAGGFDGRQRGRARRQAGRRRGRSCHAWDELRSLATQDVAMNRC